MVFFFSSRRRHTRYIGDWSSDVCSSDLGAEPFRNRIPKDDAAVVKRLHAAGAVLLAKLSLGALALNDIWFGGQTVNPWLLEEGASGSSAGPGAATAAGLVGFSIGSETGGSIV